MVHTRRRNSRHRHTQASRTSPVAQPCGRTPPGALWCVCRHPRLSAPTCDAGRPIKSSAFPGCRDGDSAGHRPPADCRRGPLWSASEHNLPPAPGPLVFGRKHFNLHAAGLASGCSARERPAADSATGAHRRHGWPKLAHTPAARRQPRRAHLDSSDTGTAEACGYSTTTAQWA